MRYADHWCHAHGAVFNSADLAGYAAGDLVQVLAEGMAGLVVEGGAGRLDADSRVGLERRIGKGLWLRACRHRDGRLHPYGYAPTCPC